jgi:uncharacterized protein (TIGR02265 family)
MFTSICAESGDGTKVASRQLRHRNLSYKSRRNEKMKVKGLVIYTRREFVQDNFGDGAWERVMAALPQPDQEALSMIVASKWYPFDVGERLDRAIVRVLGNGRGKVFEEIGAKSARRSLAKEHEAFLTPGDPQAFLKSAGVIYRYYYDTGHREYEETGPTSGVLTTYEAETFSTADCLTVIGWYKVALEMCGATNVRVTEEECRAEGGTCCRYHVSWST